MNLLEYQGRHLFKKYNIPILNGFLASHPEEVKEAVKKINKTVILKAQIPFGKRNKLGGIQTASSPHKAYLLSKEIFKKKIKTYKVNQILVVPKIKYLKEFYISFTLDRFKKKYLAIFSQQGGINIEKYIDKDPSLISKIYIDPLIGIEKFEIDNLIKVVNFSNSIKEKIIKIITCLWNLTLEEDATLVEVNPLIITNNRKKFVALDSKITLDNNALFRHPKRQILFSQSKSQTNKNENYVNLNGSIGIIGNGAGLVMSTVDLISYLGNKNPNNIILPANFLDIKGGASATEMQKSLEMLIKKSNILSIFVNIFGGITSCKFIAEGIIQAVKNINKNEYSLKPIIVYLNGNDSYQGNKLLKHFTSPMIITSSSMDDGALQAIKIAQRIIDIKKGN